MVPDLQHLLSRIEAAEGPDRVLDRQVGIALDGWRAEGGGLTDHRGQLHADHPDGTYPCLTADLRLMLDAIDRRHPGHGRLLSHTPKPTGSHNVMTIIAMPEDPEASATDPRGWGTHYAGSGATEALAACAAFVVRAIGVPRR